MMSNKKNFSCSFWSVLCAKMKNNEPKIEQFPKNAQIFTKSMENQRK